MSSSPSHPIEGTVPASCVRIKATVTQMLPPATKQSGSVFASCLEPRRYLLWCLGFVKLPATRYKHVRNIIGIFSNLS
jgi:hypothetical protein